jgi:hypothetical protein
MTPSIPHDIEFSPTAIAFAALTPLSAEDLDAAIDEMQERLLARPETLTIRPPHNNLFAPSVYLREITMPQGDLVIGAKHSTEHYNIFLTGSALVLMEDKLVKIEAPLVVKSLPNVRKVLLILETMRMLTVHPNPDNETDEHRLQEMFTVVPPYIIHEKALAAALQEGLQ